MTQVKAPDFQYKVLEFKEECCAGYLCPTFPAGAVVAIREDYAAHWLNSKKAVESDKKPTHVLSANDKLTEVTPEANAGKQSKLGPSAKPGAYPAPTDGG